ncbi:SusC/RagA family TonB-linked outer membrane protein [Desertivirga arenae]|uniref:SusC/RagA family TonB-linked outer membrane protein n=1 Tax=Desertivirga arenae TaxID=2810309 RepID=UPI001A970F46|nr:TonB-dependent receptor [Pedobacter sp. SYSU D00823]
MRILFILLLSVFLGKTTSLYAQKIAISGHVIDEKRQPMPGATIAEVGMEKNTTITDLNGNFSLQLRGTKNQIIVRTVGYLAQTVNVSAQGRQVIQLNPDVKGLEEVVIVGFGRQKRITSTGAVSTIKAEEIKTVPTSSIQNTLVGRLPGFFSQQTSGQPGADAADFYIRGTNSLSGDNKPLIVVDDVEYDYSQLQQLNVNEVESVTILKDAATTSIYGLKGANGVLVITTRRGRVGKPRINLTAETGVNNVIRMPQFLDAYTTALLRNEAVLNNAYGSSQAPVLPFSADDLQKFKEGSDPYGHPNVNWVDATLNNSSTQGRYNIDISGGSNLIKYFTSVGAYSQNGILKQYEPIGEDVNTNYFYKRYNYRSNLDFTPTKTLKIRFDVNGRFETVNNPGGVVEDEGLFYEIGSYNYLAPYAMPLQNPNGSYSYSSYPGASTTSNAIINPMYRLANGGYKRDIKNNYNIVVGADQGLGFITTGLSAKILVSYAGNNNESRDLTRNGLPVAKYDPLTNSYILRGTRLPVYGISNTSDAFNSTTIVTASLNYDRSFNGHHINTLLLLNRRNYINKFDIPINYLATTGRLDYDFKQKYLLGFTIARNGNDLFQKDQRYGIFPAVSWGYNLSQEKFFHKALPFIDLFKIRGSYGLVGTDVNTTSAASTISQANPVIQYTTTGSNYYGGTTVEGSLVNPNITWEKERKFDLGIDANMFNGKFAITGSYFYNYRYDQLIDQNGVPSLIGQSLPKKNIGITSNRGADGMITYRKNNGNFKYSLSANASYAKNKIVYISEAPNYPYQAQTGRQLSLEQGYHFIGFYQMSDFDASGKLKNGIAAPKGTSVPIQPGDLRFQDFNQDGIIDDADMTYLARPNLPTTTYGIELSGSYKGFSVRALVQGAFNYSLRVRSVGSGDAFVGNLNPWNLERWTPETASTATYPRLGVAGNSFNTSAVISDFWYVDAGYVRLKSVDVGYQIPQSWIRKIRAVQNARVYVSGYNLLTLNRMGKFQQDAEIASRSTGAAYPLTANFNFGVQLGF